MVCTYYEVDFGEEENRYFDSFAQAKRFAKRRATTENAPDIVQICARHQSNGIDWGGRVCAGFQCGRFFDNGWRD